MQSYRQRSQAWFLFLAGLVLATAGLPAVVLRADDAQAAPPVETAVDPLLWMEEGRVPASVAELRAMENHLQALCERLIPCTVGVRVGGAQGSGVIISKDGYVLTAGHVSGTPGRRATLIFSDGSQVEGTTLGANRGIDSGLIKINADREFPFVEMGQSGQLKRGQWCLALGHPGGYQRGREPVLRWGRVLSARSSVVTTDCALVGGDSGGPLFDTQGRVIGIHSRIGTSLTANMHVPVDTYRDTWDRLANSESWGSGLGSGPYIGVQGDPDVEVAKIVSVLPNSPAAKAGVQAGDIVVKFNNKAVTDFASLSEAVRGSKAGDKVKMAVLRGEETVELEVEIGRRE